jgi:Holliday junction DNA helicase RuvA
VNGIGPKIGLAMLSSLEADEIVLAILSDDLQVLSGVPGIGKKTAERMIIELRDKLANWKYNHIDNMRNMNAFSQPVFMVGETGIATIKEEAISALIALGFKSTEAEKTIQYCLKIMPEVKVSTDLIRAALQRLAKS